ncbi:MAG: nucleoside 2-deoxyribosyltransferase [Candidatus Aenigmatarchaeota archaeon]|nr:MAG: nucleoside 2-deoxyribosyltransferase [Candidatus Aenigmarchaeota archaeon]
MRKIYFAGSIRGGRGDVDAYRAIITDLQKYGQVLTEHIGDKEISALGENITARAIHDRDLGWLLSSDVVVADVSTPSLGVGWEIGRAVERGKPVLCLFRSDEGKRLSAMISGCPDHTVAEYSTTEEATAHIGTFFQKLDGAQKSPI